MEPRWLNKDHVCLFNARVIFKNHLVHFDSRCYVLVNERTNSFLLPVFVFVPVFVPVFVSLLSDPKDPSDPSDPSDPWLVCDVVTWFPVLTPPRPCWLVGCSRLANVVAGCLVVALVVTVVFTVGASVAAPGIKGHVFYLRPTF